MSGRGRDCVPRCGGGGSMCHVWQSADGCSAVRKRNLAATASCPCPLPRSADHYSRCRNTQSVFDACVLNNLNLERPPFDYYNQVRVHVSPRPKPPPPKPDVFPDPTPKLPDDYPREPAKYGSRFHWLN
uniref:NADH dehydrogenase [ubiquinone] 1 alpha subcomplex subunit 8 n=1 Tax=Timema tahoe TaxID=61484 RepID=A0A7R9IEL3_9NEOP|nr:unnamed protein product [Timema tahoe]